MGIELHHGLAGSVNDRPAHGTRPSRFHTGVIRAGALSMGTFVKARLDTPVKPAGFAYAFEAHAMREPQGGRR